ncbi:MAG: 50S ribosomal protein L5 [Candidatus Saccharimonadales bacterium]|jgi:large subunit ribosomal protein L5
MAKKDASATNSKMVPRLKAQYLLEFKKELKDELALSNVNQVPKLEKIVVSIGTGKFKDDKRKVEVATNTLAKITGQKPVELWAKKSIASFKIRRGLNKVGLKVTLRGNRMYEFLDRFISVVLPRVRDFHGVSSKSFDKTGNYNVGLTEQSVFPELTFEDTSTAHGLQITFVMSSDSSEQNKALLIKFGMPFMKGVK